MQVRSGFGTLAVDLHDARFRFRARCVPDRFVVPALAAPLQLVLGELAQRVRDLVLALVAAVQIDHRGALAVMTHTVHQLPKSRASARGQGVAGMSKVMEMEITKAARERAAGPVPAAGSALGGPPAAHRAAQ